MIIDDSWLEILVERKNSSVDWVPLKESNQPKPFGLA